MNPASSQATRPSHHGRSRARRLAAQALYQWQLTGQDSSEVFAQFRDERDLEGADREYFQELLREVPARIEALDELLAGVVDRKIEEIDPVERAILLLGAYELAHRPDIPYRVVINEAISLAKKFGATEAHTYVNGVLDHIARLVRAAEVNR